MKRFYFVREHRLHGTVTGMERVRIVSSQEDGLDRLLVSFKDAKVSVSYSPGYYRSYASQIALLEWSDSVNDLMTVSIHTYERAPQMVNAHVQ